MFRRKDKRVDIDNLIKLILKYLELEIFLQMLIISLSNNILNELLPKSKIKLHINSLGDTKP